MKKFIFACVAALFTLISCSGDLKDMNGTWETKELVFDGQKVEVVVSNIEIEATGSNTAKIYGYAGVNRFNGEIKISGNKIDCGDGLAMTKMLGDPISQTFEDHFVDVLMDSSEFEVKNDTFTVKSTKSDSYIIFTKVK